MPRHSTLRDLFSHLQCNGCCTEETEFCATAGPVSGLLAYSGSWLKAIAVNYGVKPVIRPIFAFNHR